MTPRFPRTCAECGEVFVSPYALKEINLCSLQCSDTYYEKRRADPKPTSQKILPHTDIERYSQGRQSWLSKIKEKEEKKERELCRWEAIRKLEKMFNRRLSQSERSRLRFIDGDFRNLTSRNLSINPPTFELTNCKICGKGRMVKTINASREKTTGFCRSCAYIYLRYSKKITGLIKMGAPAEALKDLLAESIQERFPKVPYQTAAKQILERVLRKQGLSEEKLDSSDDPFLKSIVEQETL